MSSNNQNFIQMIKALEDNNSKTVDIVQSMMPSLNKTRMRSPATRLIDNCKLRTKQIEKIKRYFICDLKILLKAEIHALYDTTSSACEPISTVQELAIKRNKEDVANTCEELFDMNNEFAKICINCIEAC